MIYDIEIGKMNSTYEGKSLYSKLIEVQDGTEQLDSILNKEVYAGLEYISNNLKVINGIDPRYDEVLENYSRAIADNANDSRNLKNLINALHFIDIKVVVGLRNDIKTVVTEDWDSIAIFTYNMTNIPSMYRYISKGIATLEGATYTFFTKNKMFTDETNDIFKLDDIVDSLRLPTHGYNKNIYKLLDYLTLNNISVMMLYK